MATEHGLRAIERTDLMRLCREAQQGGCPATAEACLRELGRRGPVERRAA